MNRIIVLLFLVGIINTTSVMGSSSNPNMNLKQQNNEVPIWISEVKLTEVNNGSDLFVDIYYNYSLDGSERIVEEKLFLSLDNVTFILAIHRNYDPELMPANGSSGFFFAHSVGDPLPFDIQEGQILYGYVEVITTDSTYRTLTFSRDIPITVLRSFLFRIPSWLLLVGGFAASALPIALCAYVFLRKNRRSKSQV